MTDPAGGEALPTPGARPGAGGPPAPRQQSRLLAWVVLVAAIAFTAHYLIAKTVLGGALAGLGHRLRDLVVLALLLASAWVVGERSLDWLRARLPAGAYRSALAVGLGLVPLSMAATLLAVVQAVRWWSLLLVLLLPFVLWPRQLLALPATLRTLRPAAWRPGVAALLGALVAVVYLALALSPPWDIDALTYHLTIPKEYLAHGGVPPGNGNFFAGFPAGMSMLYLYLMGLGSDLLPKLLHATFLLLMAVVAHAHFRARGGRRVAAWSVLFFVAQWTVQHGVQRANVDFHFAFYGLTAFLLLAQRWAPVAAANEPESGGRSPAGEPGGELGEVARWPALVGILLGAALAGKVHALACLAATALLLAVMAWRRMVAARQLLTVGALALAVYAPTLLRNLVYATDPLLFMVADRSGLALPAPAIVAARLRALGDMKDVFMTRPTPLNLLLVPFFAYRDGSYPTTTFDAVIDPLYLLGIPLALVLLRRDHFVRAVLLYLLGFYLAWMVTTPLTRYAMPVLPLLAYLTVASFERLAAAVRGSAAALVRVGLYGCLAAIVLANLVTLALTSGEIAARGVPAFLELMDRRTFLAGTQAGIATEMAFFIDQLERQQHLPQRGVYMVLACQAYYLDRPYVNDPFYVNLRLLRQTANQGRDPLAELRRQGFGWVLFDSARLPWLFGSRHRNPRLNPYPEGIATLTDSLQFWYRDLQPRLQPVRSLGGLVLFRIPEAGSPAPPR